MENITAGGSGSLVDIRDVTVDIPVWTQQH